MLPVLSHIEPIGPINFWITTDRVVGCSFKMKSCDVETEDSVLAHERLTQCLKSLNPNILARVVTKVSHSKAVAANNPRKDAIASLGHVVKETFLHLQYRGGFILVKEISKLLGKSILENDQFEILSSAADSISKTGFQLEPFSQSEVEDLFSAYTSEVIIPSDTSIEQASGSTAVFRMLEQPVADFELAKWIRVQDELPKPFEVQVSFRRVDEAKAKILLERQLKQTGSATDISSRAQFDETEDHILENFKNGAQLFEMEVLILVKRDNLQELSKIRSGIRGTLARFSAWDLETFGLVPSFCAMMPGNEQHVTLYESEKALGAFLPAWRRGEAGEEKRNACGRALSIFREDKSLFHFDLFNSTYNVCNTLIVGTSGKGKSVLTGLVTTSLLNDPNLRIIKIDVGGSHSKECELLGGEEMVMSLSEASGINPFSIVASEASDNDKIAIVSKFIEVLLQEQGEKTLTKSLRSEIEASVRRYVDLKPPNPSLDDFCNCSQDLPRRELLSRWVRGGLYESAFASATAGRTNEQGSVVESSSARLRYFNFSEIFNAADPEFAKAGIAAVLAEFNTLALTNKEVRIALICDETPFFINHCFEFFKMTTANVRKFGHAVVPIVQLASQLIVDGDTGIIDNCTQRFLFSSDGEEGKYKDIFRLSEKDMETIRSLRSINGEYSECLFQTETDTRKLRIEVTKEEYWRLTTSKNDKEKLASLLKAVNGLTLDQAIRALSY